MTELPEARRPARQPTQVTSFAPQRAAAEVCEPLQLLGRRYHDAAARGEAARQAAAAGEISFF